MSRIGNAAMAIPSGVEVDISADMIKVKGPKGELTTKLIEGIDAQVEDGQLKVTRADDERETKAQHGLVRSLVNNMLIGVSEGFQKDLELRGVGYRVAAKGSDALELQLGFSHPVSYKAPAGIEFEVPEQTKIMVKGIDKQVVGQVAADIRAFREPEPYKGKGIRYVGEYVIRKAGKAAK